MKGSWVFLSLFIYFQSIYAVDDAVMIRQALAGTSIDHIEKTPINGVYQVTAGKNVFYSDATGRYLLFGHLYDVKTQQDLTASTGALLPDENADKKIAWETLPLNAAVVSGKLTGVPIAIFLDPDCPYCRAQEKELASNEVLKVYTLLMPLSDLHPEAATHSKMIWCSQDRLAALTAIMIDSKSVELHDCNTGALDSIAIYAQKNQFNVTPILVRQDGKIHYGYMSLSELTAWAMASREKEKI